MNLNNQTNCFSYSKNFLNHYFFFQLMEFVVKTKYQFNKSNISDVIDF